MLGYALSTALEDAGWPVLATIRQTSWCGRFRPIRDLMCEVDVDVPDSLAAALFHAQPDVVVNCIAVLAAHDFWTTRQMYRLNAALPHRLADACETMGCRLVHLSTDGVFDGRRGAYSEFDQPSPEGAYARSKLLGEVVGRSHALTIRTSMIGMAPTGGSTLLDWLLSTGDSPVRGFSRSVFSGLPVTEIASFLTRYVLPIAKSPAGLFHLAAEPIDKSSLLRQIRREWGFSEDDVVDDPSIAINRTLVSTRDDILRGYRPPPWPTMLTDMNEFYRSRQ